MLYLVLCYFLTTSVCLGTGLLIYSFLPRKGAGSRSIIHFLITGLIGLTAVGQWIVLFTPLNLFSLLLILLLLGFVAFFRMRSIAETFRNFRMSLRNRDRIFWLCVFCFLIMILTLNAGPTIMDDTDSYHIQMVKWIQEYGSVPGIANLHLRFGFNSAWFVSIGLLAFPIHGLNNYMSLNGLLSLWFCYFILEKFFTFLQKNSLNKSLNPSLGCLVILILSLINWPMIRGCATSANYDFITTCCVVILFFDLVEDNFDRGIEWLIWPVYLFDVRMINFPLLLLSFFYCWPVIKLFGNGRLLASISIALFLILPFLTRNVILSGYAFFPVYQLDFFSFDWKADRSMLHGISEYIKYFNRVNAGFRPLAETSQLRFPEWIGSWFTYLFRFDKLITVFSVFGYLYILICVVKRFPRHLRIFLAVMVVQLICWFFIAPDPRFVQGSMLFGIYMAIHNGPALKSGVKSLLKLSVGLVTGLVLIYSVNKMIRNGNYRNFLEPRRLPVPAVKTIVLNHIELHIPSKVLNNWNPRCYNVALPCLYKLDPRVEARGMRIADGFRLKPGSVGVYQEGEYKVEK